MARSRLSRRTVRKVIKDSENYISPAAKEIAREVVDKYLADPIEPYAKEVARQVVDDVYRAEELKQIAYDRLNTAFKRGLVELKQGDMSHWRTEKIRICMRNPLVDYKVRHYGRRAIRNISTATDGWYLLENGGLHQVRKDLLRRSIYHEVHLTELSPEDLASLSDPASLKSIGLLE